MNLRRKAREFGTTLGLISAFWALLVGIIVMQTAFPSGHVLLKATSETVIRVSDAETGSVEIIEGSGEVIVFRPWMRLTFVGALCICVIFVLWTSISLSVRNYRNAGEAPLLKPSKPRRIGH
ncbi:hypothetical protein ACFL1X_14665 [Candidatus Hydrogenedentota bacterium]